MRFIFVNAPTITGGKTVGGSKEFDADVATAADTAMAMPFITNNVLAMRYASTEMRQNWHEVKRIIAERHFWIMVMEVQQQLGADISNAALDDYRRCAEDVRLDSIAARERRLRHDVVARLEEFDELAGHQYAHQGMTSRDLTEVIEQMQVFQALHIIRDHYVAALVRIDSIIERYSGLVMAGRSHNVAAQPITLGKRFAMWAWEMVFFFKELEQLIEHYPLRGIKGPMGTAQDQLEKLGGIEGYNLLELEVSEHSGLHEVIDTVGQIYPRSLDLAVVQLLHRLACGPANLALNIRLMAGSGNEFMTEGFREGRVGSSAMPHKMNASTCERIGGFKNLFIGFEAQIGAVAGTQWGEGDVSCSVVRRVVLPDAFFALDGMLESLITVLDQLGAYPALIGREFEHYAPYLVTTRLLTACTDAGMGREDAHEAIKRHATAAVLQTRNEGDLENSFRNRLVGDPNIPLNHDQVDEIISSASEAVGLCKEQIASVRDQIASIARRYSGAVGYTPAAIL